MDFFFLWHRDHTLVSKWFWLNMNGNLIDHIPFPHGGSYGIHIHKGDNISGNWKVFFWRFHVLCLAPLSPALISVHPVISLVMWEWWSRDNGTLSFHMRQEDSLQTRTCFSTGGVNRFLLSPHPRVSTVVSLTFRFHHQFHRLSFISVGATTHRTQVKHS